MDQGDLNAIGIAGEPIDHVVRLAKLTQDTGLDGVVCSAQEAPILRQQIDPAFKLVTPGIRPADADAGDQRRIVTPEKAIQDGVDYMVIGRPITQAADPVAALDKILFSLGSA